MPLGEPHTHIWAYMPLGIPTHLGSPTNYYLLHFVGGKFSRTKVCDKNPLAERAINFPNMTFFETKSKTGTKNFRNISETFHS